MAEHSTEPHQYKLPVHLRFERPRVLTHGAIRLTAPCQSNVNPDSTPCARRADRLKSLLLPVIVACAFIWPSSCAHAPTGPREAVFRERSAAADTLVTRGCYRCLQEATRIYQQLLTERYRTPLTAQKAHDSFMMLALRERELGVPDSRAGVKAHQVGKVASASPTISVRRCCRCWPRHPPRAGSCRTAATIRATTTTGWPSDSRWHGQRSIVQAYGYIALDCSLTLPADLRPSTRICLPPTRTAWLSRLTSSAVSDATPGGGRTRAPAERAAVL